MTSVAARDKNNPPHNHNSMENNSGAFSINRTTGDIFLHSALDRETFSSDPDLGLNCGLTYSLLGGRRPALPQTRPARR